MRTFFILWKKELAGYFLSPVAYVVTVFFLIVMGVSFWLLIGVLSEGAKGLSVMNELFGSIFFWLALLIVIPILTMRLFAEERRSGTFESLMTAPVRDTEVVLAKYAGALTFYAMMWLPTLAYVWVLRAFSPEGAPVDLGAVAGGYVGALVLGAFFLALGLFASALTRNQIVAAIAAFALICVFFLAGFVPYVWHTPSAQRLGGYTSAVMHMLDFARGVVDTRPLAFYAINTAFLLFATVKVVEARRWK